MYMSQGLVFYMARARQGEIYSLGAGWMRASLSFSTVSASSSMRLTRTSQVGMSWMSPMTWPAVHT